jgi:hypothetical protein
MFLNGKLVMVCNRCFTASRLEETFFGVTIVFLNSLYLCCVNAELGR